MNINVIIPVYNETAQLAITLEALRVQKTTNQHQITHTVVSDGSTPETEQLLRSKIAPLADQLLLLPENLGRAAARNKGNNNDHADILIFLDADCVPQGESFIQSHLDKLKHVPVSCGKLVAKNSKHTFWNRYQQSISNQREIDYEQGKSAVFTTANLAIKRSLFIEIGGFDTQYRHYGFEDRDFLLRCQKQNAKIAYTPTAIISHDASLSIQSVSHKMQEAGEFTANIFSKNHPEAYKQMPYGKIDLRLNPVLNYLWPVLNTIRSALKPAWIDKFVDNSILPYSIKSKLVKLFSALYFMAGTHSALKSKARASSSHTTPE